MNMKNEINEDKALSITRVNGRFFAQYWGQEVGLQCEGAEKGFTYTISEGTLNDIEIRNDKLLLKPLSKITDKDAISIAKIFKIEEDCLFVGKCLAKMKGDYSEEETFIYNQNVRAVDFLRSKGYAVPFMEYSIEDLISFGWVQLV